MNYGYLLLWVLCLHFVLPSALAYDINRGGIQINDIPDDVIVIYSRWMKGTGGSYSEMYENHNPSPSWFAYGETMDYGIRFYRPGSGILWQSTFGELLGQSSEFRGKWNGQTSNVDVIPPYNPIIFRLEFDVTTMDPNNDVLPYEVWIDGNYFTSLGYVVGTDYSTLDLGMDLRGHSVEIRIGGEPFFSKEYHPEHPGGQEWISGNFIIPREPSEEVQLPEIPVAVEPDSYVPGSPIGTGSIPGGVPGHPSNPYTQGDYIIGEITTGGYVGGVAVTSNASSAIIVTPSQSIPNSGQPITADDIRKGVEAAFDRPVEIQPYSIPTIELPDVPGFDEEHGMNKIQEYTESQRDVQAAFARLTQSLYSIVNALHPPQISAGAASINWVFTGPLGITVDMTPKAEYIDWLRLLCRIAYITAGVVGAYGAIKTLWAA